MSFSLDLSKAIKRAKGKQETVIKKVMLETFSKVVMKSPVLTGRFRSNWIASKGSYGRSAIESFDTEGSATISKIAGSISAMSLDGQKVYLVNSLPYAHVLEYGRANGKHGSLQAPNGMVRITLAEITAHYGA